MRKRKLSKDYISSVGVGLYAGIADPVGVCAVAMFKGLVLKDERNIDNTAAVIACLAGVYINVGSLEDHASNETHTQSNTPANTTEQTTEPRQTYKIEDFTQKRFTP